MINLGKLKIEYDGIEVSTNVLIDIDSFKSIKNNNERKKIVNRAIFNHVSNLSKKLARKAYVIQNVLGEHE